MRVHSLLTGLSFTFFTLVFVADVNSSAFAQHFPRTTEVSDLSFMLSPNPVRRSCVLQVNQVVDLVILDLRGQEVERFSAFSGGSLDLTDLEEGIYFLQLITPDVVRTQRLVKVEERN